MPVSGLDEGERAGDRALGDAAEEAGPLLRGPELADERARTAWWWGGTGPARPTRPSSSTTTASSTAPSPRPPSASGTVSAGQPSSTICFQSGSADDAVLHDLADEGHRALAGEHRADAVAQLLLVFGELELHCRRPYFDGLVRSLREGAWPGSVF